MAEPPSAKAMSVVLIGATGVTGKDVLGLLLSRRQDVEKVTLFGRRKATDIPASYSVNIAEEEESGRLIQHVVDLNDVTEENSKQLFEGHTTYISCFGSTRKAAGSAQEFVRIDYGWNLKFAQIAKAANIAHLSLMSTKGANANSWIHYLGTKGKLDNAVCELKAPVTSIFRPTMLARGEQARFGEKVFGFFMKPISTVTVAQAIVKDAVEQFKKDAIQEPRVVMYENEDILNYVKEAD